METELVALAAVFGPTELEIAATHLLSILEPDGAEPNDRERQRRRNLRIAPLADGGARISGYLTPECLAIWIAILDSLAKPDASHPAAAADTTAGTGAGATSGAGTGAGAGADADLNLRLDPDDPEPHNPDPNLLFDPNVDGSPASADEGSSGEPRLGAALTRVGLAGEYRLPESGPQDLSCVAKI